MDHFLRPGFFVEKNHFPEYFETERLTSISQFNFFLECLYLRKWLRFEKDQTYTKYIQ